MSEAQTGDAEAVRVVLADDPVAFRTYEEFPVIPAAHTVFEVPRARYERWAAARAAYEAVRAEIEGLFAERDRKAHEAIRAQAMQARQRERTGP